MATVRISKDLYNEVVGKARSKFIASVRDAENTRPGHHWGDFIYEVIYGKYVPIMDQLPSGFFHKKDKVLVGRVGIHPVTLYFELSAPRAWPAAHPQGTPVEVQYSGALQLDASPVWDDLLKETIDWKNRVATAIKQKEDFVAGVESVLSSFSTLAPALKEWPPLWELVPDWAKNKHKEITEKRSANKASIDKDMLGRMTGAMTAAKFRDM